MSGEQTRCVSSLRIQCVSCAKQLVGRLYRCEWMVFEMLLMTVTIAKPVVLQKRNAVSFQNTFTAVHNSTVANQLFALSNDNNNNDNAIAFF